MRKLLLITLPLGLMTWAAGCASAPKTSESPALVIPPPPPHVVPITPEPVVEPVGEIPAPPSTPAARTGRGTRETPARSTESKPEAKPDPAKAGDAGTPAETPPAATAPPGPAPQLRAADSNVTEAGVRATIQRTRDVLNTVDYRRLSSARKKAYEDAKAFAQQAEDAVKAGNLVFAQSVATKAETLARELSGR